MGLLWKSLLQESRIISTASPPAFEGRDKFLVPLLVCWDIFSPHEEVPLADIHCSWAGTASFGRSVVAWAILLLTSPAPADFFAFKHLGEKKLLHGNPLAQYADGVLLVEGPDLQHYTIEPSDLLDWKDKGKAVKPWGKDQLRTELKRSFGNDFYVQMTSHYAIVYNTDVAFARQAGTLLERTYSVFRATFANRGAFQFEDLRQPLVAVVLKSRQEYLDATKEELGQTLAWSAGMYAPNTMLTKGT
jgi:hypothetical protein